jgi:hypothetical protein
MPSATYVLSAYCAEFHKDNPSPSSVFTVEPSDNVAGCILSDAAQQGLSVQATQAAVWIYTDHVDYGAMSHKFPISESDWHAATAVATGCQANVGRELLGTPLERPVPQENTRTPQPWQQIYVGVEEGLEDEVDRVSWEKDSCSNFPKGAILTIVNNLPQPIVAYILASNGVAVFRAEIAPNAPFRTATISFEHAFPPKARLCLPAGEYRVGAYSGANSGGSEHIQAQSKHRYRVEVFSH